MSFATHTPRTIFDSGKHWHVAREDFAKFDVLLCSSCKRASMTRLEDESGNLLEAWAELGCWFELGPRAAQ